MSSEPIYIPALQSRGLQIDLLPGGARFRVEPADLLTPALRGKIIIYRAEILAELLAQQAEENKQNLTLLPAVGTWQPLSASVVDSAPGDAALGHIGNCLACGAAAVYVPCDEIPARGWGWWYECSECGDCRAVQAEIDTAETRQLALS
jgi:hypothetical protein